MEKRTSPWFVTYSGVRFFPLEAEPHEIQLVDIAHALSQINRFGGHTFVPYSVAAHSLLVSALLPSVELKLQGLLHDATEAYIGDMISPVKDLVPDFRVMEHQLWNVIAKRFDLPLVLDPQVKQADLYALMLERDALINNRYEWPVDKIHFLNFQQQAPPMFRSATAAANAFMHAFYTLVPYPVSV